MRLKIIFFLLLILVMSSNVYAKQKYSGIYGLWALDDWNAGLQLLSDNKFNVTVDATDIPKLDKALSKGIKCIVPFGLTNDIAQNDTKWKQFLQDTKALILKMKDHPAVIAWYPVDEADGQGIPVSRIKELTQFIRSLDKKPIFTVFDTPSKWGKYLPYFDIVCVDPYLRRNSGVYDSPNVVSVWLKKIKLDMAKFKLHKPIWVALGAFSMQPPDGSTPRYKKPTPDEFNQMLNYSLAEGVEGILVYTIALKATSSFQKWNLPTDDPDLWRAVIQIPK